MTDSNMDAIQAIKSAANNDEVICEQAKIDRNQLIYKTKYWGWLILLILLSPRREFKKDKMVCVTTPINFKRMAELYNVDSFFPFAKQNNRIKTISRNNSVLMNDNRFIRIILLIKFAFFYVKNHKQFNNIIMPIVIEYCMIFRFIQSSNFTEIVISANYDRYATLISNIGKLTHKKVVGIQDGAAVDISLPEELHYDVIYAFDSQEAQIIKKYVKNQECKYVMTGFKSVISWKRYNTEKKIIAIASQDWLTALTIEIVETIYNSIDLDVFEIILYPHYREKIECYNCLLAKCPKVIVSEKDRYSDISILVTFFSTIVYDYFAVNKNLPVICLKINNYGAEYYRRDNVFVVDEIQDICSIIKSEKAL